MWSIDRAGDRALLVRLGSTIDPALVQQVVALDAALADARPPGLLGTVPAYASLLCYFEPEVIGAEELEAHVRRLEGQLRPQGLAGDIVEVPTKYDGEDLSLVADATGLGVDQVINLHSEREYLVYCIGFAPGFAYCGELDQRLSLPRKTSPRQRVPAGSLAIAERQTGIYAVASPGGWNLIGHTELVLFAPEANPPCRLKAGDRIRFVAR
jgi:KipI family sensor histidine kinase inhibitor